MDPTLEEASQLHTPADRLRALGALSEQHRLRIATNPAAPADLLESLAASGGRALRKKLATNPSLPTNLFWSLAREFPRLAIENASFQLLWLMQPSVAAIPVDALLALLGTGLLEDSWFEQAFLAGHQNTALLLGLIRLPNTPDPLLIELARKLWCTRELLQRTSLPPEILWIYERCKRTDIRVLFAASSHAPPGWLAEAARAEVQVRSAVASNPRTPRNALERLLHDSSEDIQRRAALNPGLHSDSILETVHRQMQERPGWRPEGLLTVHGNLFRAALRMHENKPERGTRARQGIRARLGKALRPTTRKRAALLLKDPEALAILARSPSATIRRNVARNPATPAEILVALASDGDMKVRALVAWHDGTPDEVRTTLEHDPIKAVRKAVQRKKCR